MVKRALLITSILFLVMIVLGSFISSERGGANFGFVQSATLEAIAPLAKGFDAATAFLMSIWESYVDLVHTKHQSGILRKQLEELRWELNQYKEERLENQRLRSLLEFKTDVPTPMIPAQVVARDPSEWFETVIIDKGSNQGVRKDMAVVASSGVVGRITGASAHYSKVLLILDRNSAVSAILQNSRARGILSGRGDELCSLRYVSPSIQTGKGESVIASGLSGVFPKGLLLGTVVSVEHRPGDLFQRITVKPAVNFSTLEQVMVILQRNQPLVPEGPEEDQDADS
ncbi:MAG: rod shape-determining protein MreC [Deltaproteobacteria bacterium]|nr:rod shape-determining protein MreC [Deltaproteobacteria bacterium]